MLCLLRVKSSLLGQLPSIVDRVSSQLRRRLFHFPGETAFVRDPLLDRRAVTVELL